MKTKFFAPIVISLVLIFGASFFGVNNALAQSATPSFPDGCGSALGYSVTTGRPCNGTSTATQKFMSGCSNSAIGYSVTTGEPCDGASVAIQWLAGCNSTIGYSTVSGEPCNGTFNATLEVIPPVAPGLPTTGAGGNAMANALALALSGITAVLGLGYIAKRRRTV